MSIRYIELVDYLAIAAEVTGLDANTLTRVAKIDLAESALHAPAAGFGETEFYPDFIEKASVLVDLPGTFRVSGHSDLALRREIRDWFRVEHLWETQ